jgi:hypothetical protein
MGLSSTNFMAAPGGWTSTLANKLDKIDCSQVLSAVLKADKQFLGHVKMGAPANNIQVDWIEDELNPAYIIGKVSTNAAVTIASATYSAASLARILRKGMVLRPEGQNYFMQLTASVTTEHTITAALYGSTTFASVITATKLWITAAPWADIDTASNDVSVTRKKRSNFMQVFERAIQITQTRKNMSMEAIVDELQYQIKNRTLEVKRGLDMSVINGIARATASNTFSADHEWRTMMGIIEYIRDPDLDTTREDTTVINAATTALTIGMLNSVLYKIYDAGGFDETADPIILLGPKQQRVVAGFEKELRRVEQGERQVGYYRDVFLSDMGLELPVVLDRWVPADKVVIVDRNRIWLRPMAGDSWHLEKMAKTGRSETWQLSGQFTLEVRNSDACHGLIYGLT